MRSKSFVKKYFVFGSVVAFGLAGCASAPLADHASEPEKSVAETPSDASATRASEPAPSTSASAVALASASLEPAPSAAPAPSNAPPPRKGTVILHVGDSFVHSGLTQKLRKHFEALGVRYEVRAEQSTNSLDWSKRVPGEVSAAQPDLVIVTLGGNEIGSKHLDVQARAIRSIVKSIGDRPCVWTAPPLWMEEEGLFDTLQQNVGPCRFFETDRIVGTFIPRRKDNIHPTMEGGALWADKLYDWLMAERTGDEKKPWLLKPATEDEKTLRGHRGPLPKPEPKP